VLRAFIGTLKQCLRRRTKREFSLHSVSEAQVGALPVVQRSDSAPTRGARSHGLPREPCRRHTLAADGVWVRAAAGELRFRELAQPTVEDVAEVASRSYEKLLRVLARHGPGLSASTTRPSGRS